MSNTINLNPVQIWGVDSVYPVGSIYMSVNNTNPGTLFGGTWEQIKDTFLLSAGDTYSAGSTGGEATHILTVNEMPSHNHQTTTTENQLSINGSGGSGATAYLERGSNAYYTNLGLSDQITGNRGGSKAHNNMPPYLAVYMFKRVA